MSSSVPLYLHGVSLSINSEDRVSWSPQTRKCSFYSMKASEVCFSDAIGVEMCFLQYLLVFPSSHRERRRGRVGLNIAAKKYSKSFPEQYWGKCQGTEVPPAFLSTAWSVFFCLILTPPIPHWGSQGQDLVLAVWLQEVRGAMAVVCTCEVWHGWVHDQLLSATKVENFNK